MLSFLGFFQRPLSDDFDPVAVGVQNERNVAHTTVCELFLKLAACILKSLTCSLDIVNRDTDVAEALVWVGVAVGDLVVRIIFRSVVVSYWCCQLCLI
jgi:hypothetical protein